MKDKEADGTLRIHLQVDTFAFLISPESFKTFP